MQHNTPGVQRNFSKNKNMHFLGSLLFIRNLMRNLGKKITNFKEEKKMRKRATFKDQSHNNNANNMLVNDTRE